MTTQQMPNELITMARALVKAHERNGMEVPEDVAAAAALPLEPIDMDQILRSASDYRIEASRRIVEALKNKGMEPNQIEVAVAALKTTKEKAAEQAQAS